MLFVFLISPMFTLCWFSSTSRLACIFNFGELFGKTSVRRKFRQRNSVRRKIRSAKFPFGESSVWRKLHSAKIPSAKVPSAVKNTPGKVYNENLNVYHF